MKKLCVTWVVALLPLALATNPAAGSVIKKTANLHASKTTALQARHQAKVVNTNRSEKDHGGKAFSLRKTSHTRVKEKPVDSHMIPRLVSQAAIVIDQDTQQILLKKNELMVLPMASITKLMTGLIISEAHLPMDKEISVSTEDIDTEKGSTSRLVIGSTLPRSEMLQIALMSSENRAANALARTFPGGMATFVSMMNAKARSLGMTQTRYVEPTGLSSHNVSSARDLAMLVKVAQADPVLRHYSTTIEHDVAIGKRVLQFNTTNPLVRDTHWQIGLQKTGYITEAGRCMVLQAKIAGRKLILVFLDSATQRGRTADAQGVRRWLEYAGTSVIALVDTPSTIGAPQNLEGPKRRIESLATAIN